MTNSIHHWASLSAACLPTTKYIVSHLILPATSSPYPSSPTKWLWFCRRENSGQIGEAINSWLSQGWATDPRSELSLSSASILPCVWNIQYTYMSPQEHRISKAHKNTSWCRSSLAKNSLSLRALITPKIPCPEKSPHPHCCSCAYDRGGTGTSAGWGEQQQELINS